MSRPVRKLEDVLWAKVDKSLGDLNCWIWTASKYRNGYGHFTIREGFNKYKSTLAHRLVFRLTYPSIDITNKVIRHACDNRSCVNPRHLLVGSQKDNIHDCINKGRFLHGTKHPNCKFTDEDIARIKGLYEQGLSQRRIGALFGVRQQTIQRIVTGRRHRGITTYA